MPPYYKARTAWDDRVFPAAKGSVSGSISVPHNSDGTKTVTVVFSTRVYIFGSLDYGGSMTLTSLDRTAPTVSCSVGSITANGFKITASSSATADIWHYSINGGTSWTQFSTTAGTSASVTLSSLSPSTTYSVRVQARKRSNQVYGSSGTVYAKTLGGAVINSCTTVTADASSVSLTMNVTVYNAAYPEAEGADDLKLWMNRGSTYEKNVVPRDDISVTKHGLKIPVGTMCYADFAKKMKMHEQEFVSALGF